MSEPGGGAIGKGAEETDPAKEGSTHEGLHEGKLAGRPPRAGTPPSGAGSGNGEVSPGGRWKNSLQRLSLGLYKGSPAASGRAQNGIHSGSEAVAAH